MRVHLNPVCCWQAHHELQSQPKSVLHKDPWYRPIFDCNFIFVTNRTCVSVYFCLSISAFVYFCICAHSLLMSFLYLCVCVFVFVCLCIRPPSRRWCWSLTIWSVGYSTPSYTRTLHHPAQYTPYAMPAFYFMILGNLCPSAVYSLVHIGPE